MPSWTVSVFAYLNNPTLRVKPTPGSQLALFARYSYHGFITDRDGETLELEADIAATLEIENAIRDLKYGVGLNHLPSGRFAANAAWRPDPWILSLAPALNKYAHQSSQPANPFVVRPGQLDVALRIDHRGVAQPFLQHGNRNAPQHAVAAVGVPEGVGVGPGGVDPDLACRVLHHLADPLARQVQHWLVMVLAVGRR